MKNVRELFSTIGENLEIPEFCPKHTDMKIDANGFCSICQDDYVWDLSIEEIKKRVERIFLIHRPGSTTEENEIARCLECGQEFPCHTLQALDGIPE